MSEPVFVGGGLCPAPGQASGRLVPLERNTAGRTPVGTHRAHGRLQDGVETALGGVQVARDPLSL